MVTRDEDAVGMGQPLWDQDPLRVALVLALIGACWFAAWPYMGLWHDARLYALEALARLNAGAFERDFFLMYGSQGAFTLFPGMLASLIDWLGLDDAAYALALAGKLLWVGALLLLARQLIPWPHLLVGWLLVLAYPAFYDSHKVFSYGESFATPRVYSEALTLLALAVWLRGCHVAAWFLVVLAGSFHPLMAIPGAVLLALLQIARVGRTRVLAAAFGACLAAAFVLAMFVPELKARAIAVYDPAWYEAVVLRNPYVFLDRWGDAAFGRMVWIGVVLALVAHETSGMLRRFAFALLLITVCFLVLSWLGASVWKNVLLTQLQLWRVLWLAQLGALLLMGALFPRLWRSDYPDRVLAICLVAALLLDSWAMAVMALGGVLLREVLRRSSAPIDFGTLFWRALPYLIVLPWLVMHLMGMRYWLLINDLLLDKSIWRALLSDRVVMLAVGFAAYWTFSRAGRRTAYAMSWVVGTALLVSLWSWWSGNRAVDWAAHHNTYAELKRDIPPGSVVASTLDGGVAFIWFKLGRASYVSQDQTAGGLFNRETALEGGRRLRLMEQAGFPHSNVGWEGPEKGQKSGEVSIASISSLCADVELDFVVVGGEMDGGKWYYRNGRPWASLFACQDFREGRFSPLK